MFSANGKWLTRNDQKVGRWDNPTALLWSFVSCKLILSAWFLSNKPESRHMWHGCMHNSYESLIIISFYLPPSPYPARHCSYCENHATKLGSRKIKITTFKQQNSETFFVRKNESFKTASILIWQFVFVLWSKFDFRGWRDNKRNIKSNNLDRQTCNLHLVFVLQLSMPSCQFAIRLKSMLCYKAGKKLHMQRIIPHFI